MALHTLTLHHKYYKKGRHSGTLMGTDLFCDLDKQPSGRSGIFK